MKELNFWFLGTIVAVIGFMASNNISYGQIAENFQRRVLNELVKVVSPIVAN